MRPVNVDAVKDLIRLCVTNTASIHVVTSGAIRIYDESMPPIDGSDGYVASKWAAERILQNAASSLGLEVHIHRPLPVPFEGGGRHPAWSDVVSAQIVIVKEELINIVRAMGKRPDFASFSGYIDVAPVIEVANSMVEYCIKQKACEVGADVTEYEGQIRLYVEDFASLIMGDEELRGLQSMNPLFWFAEAKKAGLGQLVMAQRLVMHVKGDEVVARR
ncbi:hypothetical protein OCU04_007216 [Sclerotinia nivalis]|uniref:Thioester reductase (TE) domain-containing protein n=1 Tax=Sclerotinia nivalis TaxID=352851 RepID=A0A9X0ALB9_9HELO|nr:hypothetical protein OCU04_007216 [Sclerotinia nivalis]